MRLVVQRALPLTGAAGACVELIDGDDMRYAAVAGSLEQMYGMRIPRAGSLSGLCVAERSPLYAEDTATDPRVNQAACRRVGAASMIYVPLVYGDQIAG